MSEERTESGVFLEERLAKPPKDKVKLPTLKGAASREGIPFYIVPFLPAGRQGPCPKGGACEALAGQGNSRT